MLPEDGTLKRRKHISGRHALERKIMYIVTRKLKQLLSLLPKTVIMSVVLRSGRSNVILKLF